MIIDAQGLSNTHRLKILHFPLHISSIFDTNITNITTVTLTLATDILTFEEKKRISRTLSLSLSPFFFFNTRCSCEYMV